MATRVYFQSHHLITVIFLIGLMFKLYIYLPIFANLWYDKLKPMRKFIIDLFFHIYLLKFSLLANVIKTPYPRSIESIQCQWSGNTKRKTSFQWNHHQGPSTYLYIYLSINAKHRHI